jgi:hypothetical protein
MAHDIARGRRQGGQEGEQRAPRVRWVASPATRRAAPLPARRAALFDVLNTLHENEGQLVITSSLTVPEFRRQYGENLFWRTAKHCTVIDLFSEKQTN